MTTEFDKFSQRITSQISQYAEIHGSLGTGYANILVFQNGKSKIIGEMIYSIWRDNLHEKPLVCTNTPEQFGQACNDFLNGKRETMPSWCYRDGYTLSF
jgi:hypothetical protein